MRRKDRNNNDKKANKKALYLQVTGRNDGRSASIRKNLASKTKKLKF